MNLNELFEIQARLDNRIAEEHGLQGQDLLDKKILALQVELGELANEWRGFKFWSIDQEAVTKYYRYVDGFGRDNDSYYNPRDLSEAVTGDVKVINPLLEEYVDCLHFILSIGSEFGCTPVTGDLFLEEENHNITNQFIGLFDIVSAVYHNAIYCKNGKAKHSELFRTYHKALAIFLGLGEMLGFTWEQIEQAYLDKNKINHSRQDNGY